MVVQPKRPRKMESWRAVLLKERDREVDWILKIQSYRTPFLDKYFSIASMLGEEIFYILFLPLSAWVVSSQFAVHLTMLLAMSVGIGNILKNIFKIPRPPHPPVWVHTDTEKDYGLPSTHTMTAITLPWYFVIYFNYLDPVHVLPSSTLVVCVLWSLSVIISRLYNGHHSPMDVVGGALLGISFLALWTFQLRLIVDSFLVDNTYTGFFTLTGVFISALALHPVPPKVLTPAHAETGLVAGTASGTFFGLWLRVANDPRFMYSLYSSGAVPHFTFLLTHPLLLYTLRFLIGVLIVATIRSVVKKLATKLVLLLVDAKYSKGGFKYSEAEVAVKYITYSAVGWGATWLVPVVFTFIGLHLPLDDIIISKA